MLTDMIDELDKFLGASGESLTVSSVRSKLEPLREQAETQESRLLELEAGLEKQNLELQGQVKALQDEAKLTDLELQSLRQEAEQWRNASAEDGTEIF